MSGWRLVIDFEWPDTFFAELQRDGKMRPPHMQDILFEILEPLNRENIVWTDARFELARDAEGNY